MMKKRTATYGEILKKAEQFEQLQEEISKLIKQSNINKTELLKKIEMSETNLYFRFKNRDFTTEQLISIIKAILEIQIESCNTIYSALGNMQNISLIKKKNI